jgi:hypothetical protein
MKHQLSRPLATLASSLLRIYILPLIALAILVVVWRETGRPLAYFMRDLAEAMNQLFYLGLYSNLILVFWGASAAICLFSGIMLRRSGRITERTKFLLYAGITSTLLYLDDMFLLHEDRGIFTTFFGLPQALILATYATWVAYFVIRFRTTILKTDYAPLLSGCLLLALSMFVDMTEGGLILDIGMVLPAHQLLEDGPKLMGACGWLVYFLGIARREVSTALAAGTAAEHRLMFKVVSRQPRAKASARGTVPDYSIAD